MQTLYFSDLPECVHICLGNFKIDLRILAHILFMLRLGKRERAELQVIADA